MNTVTSIHKAMRDMCRTSPFCILHSAFCIAFAALCAANAATYRVTPGATGGGDGQSWASPMTIYEAVSAASASNTILLKAGTYTPSANIAVSAPISLVGGLAGTDDATLDAVSPMSVFDANEDANVTAIFSVTTATGGNTTNLFSRIEFRNGYQRGFYKTGNASLAFRDCAFTANGRNSNVTTSSGNNGRGGYFEGNFTTATLSFERCTFARNAYAGSAKSVGYGFGAYIKSWKRVFIDDSLFVSNGLAGTRVNGQWRAQDGNWGAAFYADSAPVTVVGTEFRANIAGTGGNANRGGIAFIVGNCTGGCFFRNCIFAGNACQYCHDAGTTTSSSCGPLVFASGNKDYTLDVENCTFAYNFIDGTYGTAGIDAFKGAVRVRDSIFYGAQSGNYRLCGKDIHVYGDATADVDYCLFDEDSSDSVSAAMPNLLSMGEHNSFGDPLFATPLSAITPYRITSGNYTGYHIDAYDAILSTIDVHVSNTAAAYSRAIDMGAPSASYAGEPAPNGSRVNLGAYGNTADAATSSCLGAPTLTAADITISFAGDTRPTVTATLGGATQYNAWVKLEISPDDLSQGGSAAEKLTAGGVQTGESLTLAGKGYYTPAETLYVRVTVSAPGQSDIVVNTSATVTGTLPAYVGHGGGATVIHVREGADGLQDGSDWASAFASVADAMRAAAIDSSKTEMWIAGTLTATAEAPQVTLGASSLRIRGGFTGVEDAESARASGAVSTIDGASAYSAFRFSNANPVFFERLVFTHGSKTVSGGQIYKNGGAGDVTFADCRFEDNVWTASGQSGLACYFKGTTAATVAITNCLFVGNRVDGAGSTGSGHGRVIYAESLRRLALDGCTFLSNGCSLAAGSLNSIPGRDRCNGSVIYANGAPVTARDCSFRANRGVVRETMGGIIRLNGNAYPSAFTNCLFIGNSNTYGEQGNEFISGNNKYPYGGTLLVSFGSASGVCDLEQCTFAYNISDARKCCAGVQVVKGALHAHNTIIYGNKAGPDSEAPGDMLLWDDGTATLDYVRLTGENTYGETDASVISKTAHTRYAESNVSYGDPVFATPLLTFEGLVVKKLHANGFNYQYFDNTAAGIAALVSLDAHLCSPAGMFDNSGALVTTETRYSNAIDAGDPASPYANEPDPNGSRVNLGAYGNTPQASMTTGGQPEITDVTITYPDGYTSARFDITVGGTGAFNAIVTLSIGGEVIVTATDIVRGGSPTMFTQYFNPGETYDWTVTVTAENCETRTRSGSATVPAGNILPPWANHGGGANVIHVWDRGTASGDGSEWGRSVNTFAEALDMLSSTRNEIWIHAGTNLVPPSINLSVAHPVIVRGGFTGLEDSPGDRAYANGPSVQDAIIDAATTNTIVLTIQNVDALTLDGFVFQHGIERGVNKAGTGDIAFIDCQFLDNGAKYPNTNANDGARNGRGANLSGSSSRTVAAFTNCVFAGNVSTAQWANKTGKGFAICAQSLSRLVLDSTLFATNGAAPSTGIGYDTCGRDDFSASAIYVTGVPVEARNCRFIGNRGTCRATHGGCVLLEGASGDSVFDHCLFAGNYECYGWNAFANDGNNRSGALVVNLSSVDAAVSVDHCTFAYNMAIDKYSGAGLTVVKGVANVSNSIFFGNVKAATAEASAGADITVISGTGTANVSYSLFTTNDAASYGSADTTGWAGCIYGDPLFVTDAETPAVWPTGSSDFTRRYAASALPEIMAVNCHLRGGCGYYDETTGALVTDYARKPHSPAIDAGDPASDFRIEPQVPGVGGNGHRANLGTYGNTPWATMSNPRGTMLIMR